MYKVTASKSYILVYDYLDGIHMFWIPVANIIGFHSLSKKTLGHLWFQISVERAMITQLVRA